MKPTSSTIPFLAEPSPLLGWDHSNSLSSFVIILYEKSPYISPVAWALFLLALFYKGKTKSLWYKNGYDYDIFKMLVKMRGGPARIKILQSLLLPKNTLQLAKELDFDWRSADSHVNILLRHDLIKEMVSIGTSKYFIITKKGENILTLINNGC